MMRNSEETSWGMRKGDDVTHYRRRQPPRHRPSELQWKETKEVFLFLRGLGGVSSGLFVFERGRSVFVVVVFLVFIFF